MCGGKDRFRWIDTDGKGTWVCTHCNGGNGWSLVQRFCNVDFRGALDLVRPLIDRASVRESCDYKPSQEECKRLREELWRSGKEVREHDPVGRYLTNRLGRFPAFATSELRTVQGSNQAIMLARVIFPNGDRVANLHRTFLTLTGDKIPGENCRKMMPGSFPKGAAIRLERDVPLSGGRLGIAEGIETALSATILFGIPCWSAVNEGGLRYWLPPDHVAEVVIFADNDRNYVGQAAAYECAKRCATVGKNVRVKIPDRKGDWNDVMRDHNFSVQDLQQRYMHQ